jgi:hypothetical protein
MLPSEGSMSDHMHGLSVLSFRGNSWADVTIWYMFPLGRFNVLALLIAEAGRYDAMVLVLSAVALAGQM